MAFEVLVKSLRYAFALIVALGGAGDAEAQRTPLAPVELTRIEYAPGGTRDRFNPVKKEWETFGLDQKIVYDEPTGNFLLQWNGLDGRRKTVVYRPATRLHAVVVAKIEPDSTGTGFRYVYALRNLPASQRELQAFYIETRANVDNVGSSDTTWSNSPFTDYLMRIFQVNGGWTWAQTRGAVTGLPSGESAYGFSFRSAGLPALVKCFVNIPPGMKGVGEEPPEELMAALDPISWQVPKGVTVGPVSAPEKLNPAMFLNEIDKMIDVSLQQGWILSPSLAEELRGSLRRGVSLLHRQNPEAARAALEGMLRRIEEQKEEGLLSEAYALLRYNIEYLLSRLTG